MLVSFNNNHQAMVTIPWCCACRYSQGLRGCCGACQSPHWRW